MNKCYFTLVLPCYNEHEHIISSVSIIINELKKTNYSWEIIFIDDKSSDNTASLLQKIKKKYHKHKITIFYHKYNQGRGATVAEGIRKAKGKYVGYMDIDCEISPIYLNKFINQLKKGSDIVVAKRKYKISTNSLHRFLASTSYAFISKNIFSLPISDSEAGYKFFIRKKILPVLKQTKDKHWFWDTEIIVRSDRRGLIISELPALFNRRMDKTSTVKIFTDSMDYIRSLIRLKRELNTYGSF